MLAAGLFFGVATVARANVVVEFGDANLRAAVARQLVAQGRIPQGSDGTMITPSDMEALTTLSAPDCGIVRIDGLESAANLTDLDLSRNGLDVTVGSPAMSAIAALAARGVSVSYQPQHVGLSRPTASSSAATYGKSVTFSAGASRQVVAEPGLCVLDLFHLETKTVTKKVKGKTTKVRVNYWRLREVLPMQAGGRDGLSVQAKLPYAGKWQAQVAYAGSADYEACASTAETFVVKDPRIEAAIAWAMRQVGRHSWDFHCMKFVGDAYTRGARAKVERFDTARLAFGALHASANRNFDAPRGAYVFYGTPRGHAGISLGNGMMINDYGRAGVKIMRIKNSMHYIGWAVPPLSPAITDWNRPPAS